MSSLVPLRLPFLDSTPFFPSETPNKNEALKNINKTVLGLGLLDFLVEMARRLLSMEPNSPGAQKDLIHILSPKGLALVMFRTIHGDPKKAILKFGNCGLQLEGDP